MVSLKSTHKEVYCEFSHHGIPLQTYKMGLALTLWWNGLYGHGRTIDT